MMTFWLMASGLCLVALGFVLIPLYLSRSEVVEAENAKAQRTDMNVAIFAERQGEYRQSLEQGDITAAEFDLLEIELKKNLLQEADTSSDPAKLEKQSRTLPLVLGLCVPLFAFIAYSDAGLSWGAMTDLELAQELNSPEGHDEGDVLASVIKLAKRLESQPDNIEGWFLLAQSYSNVQQYEKSAETFAYLLTKFPRDPSLSTYYAEALFMADDRAMTPRVVAAVETSLEINPQNISMLEIKAMAAFQADDLQGALAYFEKAIAAGADEDRAQMIRLAMKRIGEDMLARGMTPVFGNEALADNRGVAESADAQTAGSSNEPFTAGRSLQVLVEVADSVSSGASASVFVFARAIGGPPMPLAVQRMVKGALPKLVTLDESMAMMEGMGLANFDQVEVVARISSSGIANVSPDDYQAISTPIDLNGELGVIKLVIEKKVKDQ
jgi:cytochrome c-type biogenesis protein CcmH